LRISKIILLVMLYRMAYVSSWDSRGPFWASSFNTFNICFKRSHPNFYINL